MYFCANHPTEDLEHPHHPRNLILSSIQFPPFLLWEAAPIHSLWLCLSLELRFPLVAQWVKNLPADAGDTRDVRYEFDPWVGRRKWQPIPVFLPGKFYGQRSLEGYSPWGFKDSDMTEWACACARTHTRTHTHTHTHSHRCSNPGILMPLSMCFSLADFEICLYHRIWDV